MGLPSAATDQLSILWQFLHSGEMSHTLIWPGLYRKRNRKDSTTTTKKIPTKTHTHKKKLNQKKTKQQQKSPRALHCIKIRAIKIHILSWNQRTWSCNWSTPLFHFPIDFLLNTFASLLWKWINYCLTVLLFHCNCKCWKKHNS